MLREDFGTAGNTLLFTWGWICSCLLTGSDLERFTWLKDCNKAIINNITLGLETRASRKHSAVLQVEGGFKTETNNGKSEKKMASFRLSEKEKATSIPL